MILHLNTCKMPFKSFALHLVIFIKLLVLTYQEKIMMKSARFYILNIDIVSDLFFLHRIANIKNIKQYIRETSSYRASISNIKYTYQI